MSLGRIKALFHETDKYRSSLLRQLFTLSSLIAVKSHKNRVTGAGFKPVAPLIWPIAAPRATVTVLRPVRNSPFSEISVSLHQTNNPVTGGALVSGNMPVPVGVTFSSR